MARVFSGVQPTGEGPHIGNYIGAFRRWVDLQDTQDECFYCVVDLHAMTVPWEQKALAEGVRRTVATLIATGIDRGSGEGPGGGRADNGAGPGAGGPPPVCPRGGPQGPGETPPRRPSRRRIKP
jgi:hypothetical protein